MKFNCEICNKKVETNDAVFSLEISCSIINEDEELGDFIHSPLCTIKVCSWCAEHINLILTRGNEKIKEETQKPERKGE